jgi:hypothetical protein
VPLKNLNLITLVISAAAFSAANAGAPGQDSPPVSSDFKTIKCKALSCIKVELHHKSNTKGLLTVFQKEKGIYVEKGHCPTIGGQAKGNSLLSAWTPPGVHHVYKKTRPLLKHATNSQFPGGIPENGYDYASYFYPTPKETTSDIAIHTTPTSQEYNENSHACLRTVCAPEIYKIQGDIDVQIDYVD